MKLSCKNVLYGTKKFLNPEKRKLKGKHAVMCKIGHENRIFKYKMDIILQS